MSTISFGQLTGTQPDYERIGKEAFEKFKKGCLDFDTDERVKALSSLLAINIEELPEINKGKTCIDDFCDGMREYDVMKIVIHKRRLVGIGGNQEVLCYKEIINGIMIKSIRERALYTIFAGKKASEPWVRQKITFLEEEIATYKVKHETDMISDDNLTKFNRFVINFSPTLRYDMLRDTLSDYHLALPLINIIRQYAGLPTNGKYDLFKTTCVKKYG